MRNWLIELSQKTKRPTSKINLETNLPIIKEFQKFLSVDDELSLVLYSFCLLRGRRQDVSIAELIEFLEPNMAYEKTIDAIEDLFVNGYFIYGGEGPFSNQYDNIFLSPKAELALRRNDHSILPLPPKNLDDIVLLHIYARAGSFRNKSILLSDWIEFTENMMVFKKIPFIQYLNSCKLPKLYRAMALFTGILHQIDHQRIDPNLLIQLFSNSAIDIARMKKELKDNSHVLYKKNVLVLLKSDFGSTNIGAHEHWGMLLHNKTETKKITPAAKALQLYEYEQIQQKQLIYNPETEDQVRFLRKILVPKTLKKYELKAKINGEPSGIIVLLSGGPGTGKTELAKQLALETKRDLLWFNVSEQRNMYLGETEKAIKLVFDDYKRIQLQSKSSPILFFNEGDSVFSNRSKFSGNTSQTENSVQTILLQELESFNGILIITSNRPESFDPAFQRRMLLHISINEPIASVRFELLKTFFPDLQENDLSQLSNEFSFTAAQLNVFLKQWELKELVKECSISQLNALTEFLLGLQVKKKKKIGF
ncbi:MAG: ATP-binding protein [Bacteroidota bacterium]